jgi:nucleotide-binding universal stress UspA family protein
VTWHQDLVVVGVDGTERDADALALAARLASSTRCRLLAAHAHPFDALGSLLGEEPHAHLLRELFERVREHVLRHAGDAQLELRLLAEPSPAKALQRVAAEEGARLLVVGASRRQRIELTGPGSVTERVVQGSPCAVAVAPPGYAADDRPLTRIGCAFDGGGASEAALEEAAHLARLSAGALRLIGVFEPIAFGGLVVELPQNQQRTANSMLRDHFEKQLREAVDELGGQDDEWVLLDGDVVERLVEESADLDLLVVGSRGYGPFRSTLIGGVSGRVVRAASCPVLVCLREANPAP